MNGPAVVYRLKPVFEIPSELDLPTCMYKMKNQVACVTNAADHTDDEKEILAGVMDKKTIPELAILVARWDSVFQQLDNIKLEIESLKKVLQNSELAESSLSISSILKKLEVIQGAVITANPSSPPYSLLLVKYIYQQYLPIHISCHVHSNLSSLPDNVKCFSEESYEDSCALKLMLIWKDTADTELTLNPVKQLPIKGEVNILRFLARAGLELLEYPSSELFDTTQTDYILDICHKILHLKTHKERISLLKSLDEILGSSVYFGDEKINIRDISVWSTLKQININPHTQLTLNMGKWYKRVDELLF